MADDNKLVKWTGEQKDWKGYAKQKKGYKLRNEDDFAGYEGIPDPRKRDRVTQRYQVAADQHSDPTGAEAGAWVNAESEAVKARKEKTWAAKDVKWYYTQYDSMVGTKGQQLADEMATESGLELETKVAAHYGTRTNCHAAHNLKEWVRDVKGDESMANWCKTWYEKCQDVEANLRWDQMRCILFLHSLGDEYKGFFDIATSGSDKLDLQDLMKRAEDHARGRETDERRSSMAMAAAEQQRQQPPHRNDQHGNGDYARPCRVCGNQWHCKAECFRPGGGLAHLSTDERASWLEAQRTQREHRRQQREQRDQYSGRHNTRNRSWRRDEAPKETANYAVMYASKELELTKLKQAVEQARKKIDGCGLVIDHGLPDAYGT